MKGSLKFSKYHLGVIFLYLILTPLVFIFMRSKLKYNFSYENFGWVITICISTLAIFLSFLFWKKDKPKIALSGIILAILYGIIFAFPEEIIFRGIIQGFLQLYFINITVAVLMSSLIFGIAHLANGAKSFNPRYWNWKFAGLTFLAGLPLGLIFALTNSLLIPTLLHTLLLVGIQLFTQKGK